MAQTTVKGSGSTVNDGGTIVNAGNVSADSKITKVLGLNEVNGDIDYAYGSRVIAKAGTSQDYSGVTRANSSSAGGLAYFPDARVGDRNFLLKGAGDTSGKVNNSNSTVLSVPGSEYDGVGVRSVDRIHKSVSTRRLGSYATASFNVLAVPSTAMVPGRTKGTGAGSAQNFVQANDGSTAASDDAASPTLGVPGELTYHFGALAKPTNSDYKALDSAES
jgi:hypothetical protein